MGETGEDDLREKRSSRFRGMGVFIFDFSLFSPSPFVANPFQKLCIFDIILIVETR